MINRLIVEINRKYKNNPFSLKIINKILDIFETKHIKDYFLEEIETNSNYLYPICNFIDKIDIVDELVQAIISGFKNFKKIPVSILNNDEYIQNIFFYYGNNLEYLFEFINLILTYSLDLYDSAFFKGVVLVLIYKITLIRF